MRLAVLCHPTYGGSGVVATELAKALARRGHCVHLVSWEAPFRFDPDQENLFFHRVEVSDYPLFKYRPYSLNLTNELIRLVEDEGVEVVHSHYAIPHAHTAWMAREVLREERGLDVKLACTLHGTDITLVGVDHGFYELTRFSIRRQDLLTAPSRWLASKTEQEFHAGDPILVIPNFVDLERFRPGDGRELRERLGIGDRKIVTHASNFRPVKRVPDVISGFANLRAQIPSVLLLVGDGPELEPALEQARRLGVADDVHALGRIDAIEEILRASDLFLLPSIAESFGLSALEAQACGCPVLGYRTGGLPEVVRDGESGILCPEGQEVCLGGLAADLFADPERYEDMRRAARENALSFDLEPIVDRYENELQRLVDDTTRRSAAS